MGLDLFAVFLKSPWRFLNLSGRSWSLTTGRFTPSLSRGSHSRRSWSLITGRFTPSLSRGSHSRRSWSLITGRFTPSLVCVGRSAWFASQMRIVLRIVTRLAPSAPSSSGLGRRPLKAETAVQICSGLPAIWPLPPCKPNTLAFGSR